MEYTRLQAITICVKTVRETQALNILLLRQEVYLIIRDHALLTAGVFQFIQYSIYRCINIHVTRHKKNSLKCYYFSRYKLRGIHCCSPSLQLKICWVSKVVSMHACQPGCGSQLTSGFKHSPAAIQNVCGESRLSVGVIYSIVNIRTTDDT